MPEGAKLTSDRFEWVPGEFQLGTHPLIFDYQTEVSQRSLTVNIDVDYPQFLLPEEPDLIVYGKASGSLYGFDSDLKTITRFELQNQDGVSQCVSCAKRDFPWSISSIVEKVNGDRAFVCVASQGNGPPTVHVMDAVSLEEIGKIEVPTGCWTAPRICQSERFDRVLLILVIKAKRSDFSGNTHEYWSITGCSPSFFADFPRRSVCVQRGFETVSQSRSSRKCQAQVQVCEGVPSGTPVDEKTIVDSESSFFYISGQVYSPLSSDSPVASEQPVIHLENDVVITAREEPDEIIFTHSIRTPSSQKIFRSRCGSRLFIDWTESMWASLLLSNSRNRIVVLRGQAVAVHPLSRLRMENKPAMVARMEHRADLRGERREDFRVFASRH